MKAINVNGTIKTYTNLKSFGGAIGLQYASDSDLEAMGFYDVVTPSVSSSQELGPIEWDADNNVFTYPVVNKVFSETLSDLREQKIENLKSIYNVKLSKTDWYVHRKAELGTAIPQDVLDARAALRTECSTKEAEIIALNTKADIIDYELPNIN